MKTLHYFTRVSKPGKLIIMFLINIKDINGVWRDQTIIVNDAYILLSTTLRHSLK